MNSVLTALLIPFLGTALGSAFVFFMKREMPALLQKVLLGFASGVMVAASVWSLIIPAIEMGEGPSAVVSPVIGLLAGFAFLLLIDYITPHIHPGGEAEGPQSRLSRTTKLALAVTIHNFPEGMAVGVAIAGALAADFNMAAALALSLGIACPSCWLSLQVPCSMLWLRNWSRSIPKASTLTSVPSVFPSVSR